jgi:hypothetical protein
MKRLAIRVSTVTLATALVVALLGSPVRAQFAVFDPANYAEAIAEVEQMITQYEFLLQQAQQLPVNMFGRYHAQTPVWPLHDSSTVFYAGGVLTGLNAGDPSGAGYKSMADLLQSFEDVAGSMPGALSGSLSKQYANIELADAVATMGIDQVGQMRATASTDLQVINSMEADAFSGDDSFQTQTAILNKINAANVLALRVAAQNHEFLGDTLEQLIVDNKRKRDAETRLMNATVNQWRYGQAYGADLFSKTAANIATWQPFQ